MPNVLLKCIPVASRLMQYLCNIHRPHVHHLISPLLSSSFSLLLLIYLILSFSPVCQWKMRHVGSQNDSKGVVEHMMLNQKKMRAVQRIMLLFRWKKVERERETWMGSEYWMLVLMCAFKLLIHYLTHNEWDLMGVYR